MLGKESKQNYLKIQIIIETYEGLFPELVVTTLLQKEFFSFRNWVTERKSKMFIYSLVEI